MCLLVSFAIMGSVHAVETHTKLWTSAVFTGPISAKNDKIIYYLQPDLRFIDDKYKFSQAVMWAGLGYRITPGFIVYAGDASATNRNTVGEYTHLNIIWQQVNVTLAEINKNIFTSRTRLQEIKNVDYDQWGIIIRERLLMKAPIVTWDKHFLVLYDELFFNLKNPDWSSSNKFISQNRAFIGVETKISKITSFTIGYLNQYEFRETNQMSNILFTGVEVKTG
jgi:hypothetical protein